ncbi:MAG: hypothetical protein ABI471_02660 [Sphingomonas bacterium]
MIRTIFVALPLACAGCAPLSAEKSFFGQATPLCDVVKNEQRYAGQRIMVRAFLVSTPHEREIYDPECRRSAQLRGSSDAWNRNAQRVIEAALANNKLPGVPVVVSGIFQPWTRYENGRRIINAWGPYIEEARIVAARQP